MSNTSATLRPARRIQPLLAFLLLLSLLCPLPLNRDAVQAASSTNQPALPASAVQNTAYPARHADLARLPLAFTPDSSVANPDVRFQVRSGQSELFFGPGAVTLVLPPRASTNLNSAALHANAAPEPPAMINTVQLSWEGANPVPELVGAGRLPGVINLLTGNDPASWHSNIPTYAGLLYRDLYPGVDLRYEGDTSLLKGTYTLAPHADFTRIRWHYTGIAGATLDAGSGDLVMSLSVPAETSGAMNPFRALRHPPVLIERAPAAWQELNGQREMVPVRYSLADDGTAGFALGRYDPAYALTIDPPLVYSVMVDGSNEDQGRSIAVDSAGNAYITGYTLSSDLPVTGNALQPTPGGGTCNNSADPTLVTPCYDAFVAKVNAVSNTLDYITYLGGNHNDFGSGIAVDGAGNVYVTGGTRSSDFPTVNALQPANRSYTIADGSFVDDAFVAKLNPAGNTLLYSTYLGSWYIDDGNAIAVDAAGNIYIAGTTNGADNPDTALDESFPLVNAFQPVFGGNLSAGGGDAFVAKLNPSGSALIFSTFLGGNGDEALGGIAVDAAGAVYVAGSTNAGDFPQASTRYGAPNDPCRAGGYDFLCSNDGFVVKFAPSGSSLLYSLYLGGSDYEYLTGIAIDDDGNAYLTGVTQSSDFPTVNPLQAMLEGTSCTPSPCVGSSAFVTKLSPTGSSLVFSTFLGGVGYDGAYGVAVDASGTAYVTGETRSPDFPLAHPLQAALSGPDDAFVTAINAAGTGFVYSTYLGGPANDTGWSIAVDDLSNVYITGSTASAPAEPTGNQPAAAGGAGALIAKVGGDSDGDGLPDAWEMNGLKQNGIMIDLPAMGADPMHKDVFVHADWMDQPGIKPENRDMQLVVEAYAQAPVQNPDKTTGIHLHIDTGLESTMYIDPKNGPVAWGDRSQAGPVPYKATIGATGAGGQYDWAEVDQLKQIHFDPAQRGPVFHYACFCSALGGKPRITGISRSDVAGGTGGHDFLVTLGQPPINGGTPLKKTGTFMHELGHNLGLEHGGGDSVNFKPNYLSVMNYHFQLTGLFSANDPDTRQFDYSRRKLPDLNERALAEGAGIGDPDGHGTFWNLRARPGDLTNPNVCLLNPDTYNHRLPYPALDWNCDGQQNGGMVVADINLDGYCVEPGPNGVLDTTPAGDDVNSGGIIIDGPNRRCDTAKKGDDIQSKPVGTGQPDLLHSFEDWPALKYDGGGTIGKLPKAGRRAPAASMAADLGTTEVDELPYEQIIQTIPPAMLNADQVAPVDVVTQSVYSGAAPLAVTFDGRGSQAPGGTLVTWVWDFGDGTTGTGPIVQHYYTVAGVYTITLRVTDNQGHKNLVALPHRLAVQSPKATLHVPVLLRATRAGW